MSTVTVVATVEPSTTPPRVRLDVTDIGSPNLFSTIVTRLNPDGRIVPVRTLDGNPLTLSTSGANRIGLLYDYEAPYGTPVSYSTIDTPTSTSAEVTVPETRVWMIHPGVPALSVPVTVAEFSERTRTVQRGVFHPLGRATPVVVTDGARKAAEYSLTLLTSTVSDRDAFDTLITDASALLFNVPAAKGWGVTAEYVAVGDITEERVTRMAYEPMRRWQLACTVIDRPGGGSQSQRTYADLLVYSSYAELRNAYPTYLDLLAGP